MKTVILIYSDSPNTGKTYLGNLLLNRYKPDISKISFSSTVLNYITVCLQQNSKFSSETQNVFKNLYIRELKETPLQNIYPDIDFKGTMRDFIAYKSLEYKKQVQDKTVFTKLTLKEIEENLADLIIIDDFRLPQEYTCLKESQNIEKIITIKISKEGSIKQKLSELTSKFENQLKDFNFDLEFVYNKDYSNTELLLNQIDKVLGIENEI